MYCIANGLALRNYGRDHYSSRMLVFVDRRNQSSGYASAFSTLLARGSHILGLNTRLEYLNRANAEK